MGFKASVTQRMVNSYPSWSAIRSNQQSLGYSLFNALGKSIEDLAKQSKSAQMSYNLTEINLELLDRVYRLNVRGQFDIQFDNVGEEIMPFVVAETGAGIVTVNPALENDIREFWDLAIPTRATAPAISLIENSLLIDSDISLAPFNSTITLSRPDYLWVKIEGGEQFISFKGQQILRGLIKITGTTEKGLEESEEIAVLFDEELLRTNKIWKEITQVDVFNVLPNLIGNSATLKVSSSLVNEAHKPEWWHIEVDSVDERKFAFWSITESTGAHTVLSETSYLSNRLDHLDTSGVGAEKLVQRSVELLDTSGLAITPVDVFHHPHKDWLWVADDTTLYLYDSRWAIPDVTKLTQRNFDTPAGIVADDYYRVLDDEVDIDLVYHRPIADVRNHRLLLEKPDGTTYAVQANGTLSAALSLPVTLQSLKQQYFVPGTPAGRNFRSPRVFTLDQRGEWIFTMQTVLDDGTLYTDQKIVLVESRTPLAQFTLWTGITGVHVDADQKVYLTDGSNEWRAVNFNYDYFLLDSDNEELVLREPYTEVFLHG